MNNETQIISVEDIAQENGIRFWYAHDLSKYLDYKDFDSFKNVVKKARASADQIGVDSDDEFISVEIDGKRTFKLTRFACWLCVLHADTKKPNVALAKVSLAKFADLALQGYNERLDRIEERHKLSHGENFMENIAKQQGLSNDKFGLFKDAGYRGMYNMSLKNLKAHKGIANKEVLYDYMNITELAANTFRVTQTAEKIKNRDITGDQNIINAANEVGKQVRGLVRQNTGINPENFKIEDKINHVKKELKDTRKKMVAQDKVNSKKKMP